jgi:hypothetical protein
MRPGGRELVEGYTYGVKVIEALLESINSQYDHGEINSRYVATRSLA